MSDSRFMILSLLGLTLLLLGLVVSLALMLARVSTKQLRMQNQENQLLRNQLRAQDVVTLNHLNQVTVPQLDSDEQPSVNNLIFDEEQLAAQGYSLGDLSDDLSANGWSTPLVGGTDARGYPEVFER